MRKGMKLLHLITVTSIMKYEDFDSFENEVSHGQPLHLVRVHHGFERFTSGGGGRG